MSLQTGERIKWAGSWMVAILLLGFVLSACSTGDDEGETPTAAGVGSTATTETNHPTNPPGTTEPANLTDANGQSISDGLCLALIPDGWVDDGTGRGTTTGGHRFVLFGGRVSSDADWERAVEIVGTPTAGRSVASIEREDDSIYVVYAGDLGFEYRQRFDTRYCDLTVSSSSRPISEAERAFWPVIIESLTPVQ